MAVSFNIPASPKRSVITIDDFMGCDFTNSPASADINKSPNCVNMIRDVPGKVRKCMGYEQVEQHDSNQFPYCLNMIKAGEDIVRINNSSDSSNYCEIVENKIRFGRGSTSTDYFNVKIPITYLDADTADLYSLSYSEDIMPVMKTDDTNTDGHLVRIEYRTENSELLLYIMCIFREGDGTLTDWITYKLPKGWNKEERYLEWTEVYSIYGFHRLHNDDVGVVHASNYLTRGDKVLYDRALDERSKSWEFDDHLYIVDGKKLLRYGFDLLEKSDLVYKDDKANNRIVINEEVTFTVKEFTKSMYSLEINAMLSSGGYFQVSKDKRSITYTNTLTSVGQDASYWCQYEYKKTKTGSLQTGSMSVTHHLIGITDQKEPHVVPVEEVAYVPLVTISKDPSGGGEPYEDLNLLTNAFKEQFLGQASVKDYCLSFDGLDAVEPIAEVLNGQGEWVELTYGTDYTANYDTGVITFTTAPGVSPVTGEDNVRITAYRTVPEYTDRINKCTIGALYGVNGALDRLFLSGNPDYINYDWYSAQYDPTYFADTSYSVLGSSGSAIVGYSIISNYLAAHKDKNERDQNIILREGDLVESEPSFRIINTLQGAGAVAPFSFAYLATEPLFLTEQGIYAVTAQDITGEKYAQNRSFFLDGKLLQEPNLENAYAIVHNDMYWLCLNGVAYILDGLQPIQTDKQKPYATRQYVGFYRTNLPATCIWENSKRLFFGTEDGKVFRFFNEKYELSSYNDNGQTIECVWDTPDIIGKLFFKNKTLRHVAIKLDSAHSASVNIYILNRGLWQFIRKDTVHAKYFQFSKLVFSKFSFSPDKTQHTIPSKVRIKKVDKFRLRLTNDELNESFALYNIGFEYIESNNYKG